MKPFISTFFIYFGILIAAGFLAYFGDLSADQTTDMVLAGLLINIIYGQQKATQ